MLCQYILKPAQLDISEYHIPDMKQRSGRLRVPQAELYGQAIVTFNDRDDIFIVTHESGAGRLSRPAQLGDFHGGPACDRFCPVQFCLRVKAGSGQCGKVAGIDFKLPAFAPAPISIYV